MNAATCFCPHCGQKIEFDLENVGMVAPCPACGKESPLTALAEVPPAVAVCSCLYCGQQIEFQVENAGVVVPCPQCGKNVGLRMELPAVPGETRLSDEATPATIKSKTEFAGVGAAIQAVGLLSCFIAFPVGIIVGVMLIVIGARMAIRLFCSNCGNRVENREVKMCAVCHTTFAEKKRRNFALRFGTIIIGALITACVLAVFVHFRSGPGNIRPAPPATAPAVKEKMFPPLTSAEVTQAKQIITDKMNVTHDDVKDTTCYQFNYGYETSVSLYIGVTPNQTAFLRLHMWYYGDHWIFTKQFLVRADNELLTISPKKEMEQKNGGSDVWEIYDEPAEENINTIYKIIRSKSCTVRFDGDHSYSDYTITDGDRVNMADSILAYRYLGGNFEK
jgi:predicted RNA-binding Zn-ribbon protein involved in translation (DUF1610 family)